MIRSQVKIKKQSSIKYVVEGKEFYSETKAKDFIAETLFSEAVESEILRKFYPYKGAFSDIRNKKIKAKDAVEFFTQFMISCKIGVINDLRRVYGDQELTIYHDKPVEGLKPVEE